MNNEALRRSEQLAQPRLAFVQENYPTLADQAAREQWTHGQYPGRPVEGESQRRLARAIARRVAAARFPMLKTLDQFNWNWPKKINRPPQVQHLFSRGFLNNKASVILVGGVGLGKHHRAQSPRAMPPASRAPQGSSPRGWKPSTPWRRPRPGSD